MFSGEGPDRLKGSLFDGYPKAFAPRVGLAYKLMDKTVIRAYGARSFAAVTGLRFAFDTPGR